MISRKLNWQEVLHAICHDYLYGTTILFSSIHIEGKINHQIFKETLHVLYKRHPLLRAIIHKIDNDYYFELNALFSSIPITFISRSDNQYWQKIVEQELNQMFPTTEYLWRVTLLYDADGNNELIFVFHHSIVDGLSSINLAFEFFHYYDQLISGKLKEIKPLPFLGGVESLLAKHTSWQELKARKQEAPVLPTFPYHKYLPLGGRTTKSIYLTLDSDKFFRLKEKCRLEKVKVNSVFNLTILLTAKKIAPEKELCQLITLFNLRKFCHPIIGNEHVGNYSAAVDQIFRYNLSDTPFWQVAQIYEKDLNIRIAERAVFPSDYSIATDDLLSKLMDVDAVRSREKFSWRFVVSNKGYVEFEKICGPLRVKAYYTSSSMQADDTVIKLSVTSLQNKIFACFNYIDPLIDQKLAEMFVDQYVNLLQEVIE